MALPALCDVAEDPCCMGLFEAAEDLLGVAHGAVLGCLPDALCDGLSSFVSVGEPSYAEGNYVAVWLMSEGPGFLEKMPRPRAQWGVRLIETGWPVLRSSDGAVIVPTPEEMHHAALHSYGHLEVLRRTIYGAFRSRTLNGCDCSFQEMGAVTPVLRSGGMVGWQFPITLGVCW